MKNLQLYLLFFVILASLALNGKTQEKKLIQFSGILLSADTLEPVPYAAVYNKTIKRTTFADQTGFFSFVVQTGDTVMFASTGYKNTIYIVPDTLSHNRYTVVQLLKPDTIYLKETTVYPWPTKEQFAKAFIELELPRSSIENMNRNQTLQELHNSVDFGDALSSYDAQMSKEYSRLYSQGQIPTVNLLSPSAWKKFIKTWKSGGFKRQ